MRPGLCATFRTIWSFLQANSGHKLAGILLVSHVSDYLILFQANSGHQLAGILHVSHVYMLFLSGRVPTHTSNHSVSLLLCFKNKQVVFYCCFYCFLLYSMFLHPQKISPGPPVAEERSRAAGAGLVRVLKDLVIETEPNHSYARALTSTGRQSSASRGQGIFFC